LDKRPRPGADTIVLHRTAYVTAKEFAEHGVIVGAGDDKFLLSTYDTVYIQFPDSKSLPKVGDEYTIYDRAEETGDAGDRPADARKLGSLVSIRGRAVITRADKDTGIATAEIREAIGTIERGQHAGPFKSTLAVVPPVPNAVELKGAVVEAIRDEGVIGRDSVVIVNRGDDDGVKPGNTFLVLRRGDGLPGPDEAKKIESKDAARTELPFEAIAELRVIDVKSKTSTCFVTMSTRDVQIGDQVLMRKEKKR
jgi:hypothetical protein